MSLREGTRFREFHINVHSNYGGIGDHIARLTAIRWVMRERPHVRMTIYWHNYFLELAKKLLPPNEQVRYLSTSDLAWADENIPLTDFEPTTISSTQFPLIDYAFIRLTQRLPPTLEDTFYPKVAPAPQGKSKTVIVAPCYTSGTRKWKGEYINETMRGIKSLGYQVVLVGETEPYQVGNGNKTIPKLPEGIDLSLADENKINQLSLVETLQEINCASAIVGIDNGLLHLSACTDTPSVWGFTSVYAENRVPKDVKHMVVKADISCYGCQSQAYLLKHDFRKCMFGDYKCLDSMTGDSFLHSLKKILAINS